MIDFKNVNSAIRLTPHYILSRIDDFTIMQYYHGPFKLGKVYSSKFRKDSNPSCGFYMSKSGKIIYNDITNGERLNCFEFVMKIFSCNFNDALNIIAEDFGLVDRKTRKVTEEFLREAEEFDKEYKRETLIQFIPDSWNSSNLKFWNALEISKGDLISEDSIYPISRLFLNKREIYNPSKYQRYAYVVDYPIEGNKWKQGVKVYSPNDPNMKWLSSIPLAVPFGINTLPAKSDTLIITKSNKDRIVLKNLFTDVIAVQNESEAAFPKELQDMIFQYYKKGIVIFGADPQGVEACKNFNDRFSYFNTPKQDYETLGLEDPADIVRVYGLEYLKELLIEKNICPNIKSNDSL